MGTLASRPTADRVRDDAIEVSIVMPCLNEAETLGLCIEAAFAGLRAAGIRGEVVVADNGSSDGSVAIARGLGARVVEVASRGYGSAVNGGIEAARSSFIVVADADASYDFSSVPQFLAALHSGADLVMGNRFQGGIQPGAMPWLNRWFGNPLLSGFGRLLFRSQVGDFHCGIRGLTRSAFTRLNLTTTGMEYASEMVIKASVQGLRVTEIAATLAPAGRSRPPHLRPWRDGWRHLRFMLLFSPRWLFLIPGCALLGTGLLGSAMLTRGPVVVGGVGFDVNTLLVAGFLSLLGYQLVLFAVFSKVFAVRQGFHPPHPGLNRLFRFVTLEVGLVAGALMALAGLAVLVAATLRWKAVGFGALDPRASLRLVVPAVVLLALGVQTVFASFFLSILGIDQRVTLAAAAGPDSGVPGRA